MILFKIGDETPYMPMNLCLKFQHEEYRKRVQESIEARKQTNIADQVEKEGGMPISNIPPFEAIERYKDLKVSVRMTSADEYYLVSARISELSTRHKTDEIDKVELNVELKKLQRDFLKLALVGVKGFKNEDGSDFDLDNSEENILALDGGNYVQDIFAICQYYQGLNAAEKKRFKQSAVSI